MIERYPLGLPIHCQRCGERIRHANAVMLFLNTNTGEYRAEDWPGSVSQGGFWFGKACSVRALRGDTEGTRKPRRRPRKPVAVVSVKPAAEIAEIAACDFCGAEERCATSEQGSQRFDGDHIPAHICRSCAAWALESLKASPT